MQTYLEKNSLSRGSTIDQKLMNDRDANIARTLEGLASSQPTQPAIHVPGRTSLTYADLGAQIRYVRERLGNWDIGRGDIVAGVIPSRPEMAVACATVPGAATFAPLSPDLTTDVYSELLARLRPKALITPRGLDHAVRAAARRHGIAEIELLPDASSPAGVFTLELARPDESLRGAGLLPPDIAYIVSTSGTTNRRQKLVPYTHRRLTFRARVDGDWWGISATDVGYHLESMHRSMGLQYVLTNALLRGSSFACLAEHDIDGLFGSLDQYRPTWLTVGFAVHRAILRRAAAFPEIVARSRFRFLRSGSGALAPDEIDRIEQTFRAPLLVAYGSTECAAITADPLPPRARKRGSVGLPMTSEVAVMNDARGFCSAGEVGEIVVRDPVMFTGYIDDPQATAAAFIGDWFRTGDLGRFDEDGYFYLAGRIKDMINRGGEKISPVELDAAIEAIPGVRAAATFAIAHRSLGEEVVAAVVREGDVTVEAADIIDQVRRRMGPKQVPRHIYFVNDLPRTDNGKVRRSELPRLLGLDQADPAAPKKSEVKAPAPTLSPLEAALGGLWSSVLQVSSVGVNDDFFLLGGDSLRGARLLTSVKAVFGVDLPIELLFRDAATIADMARAIEAARSDRSRVTRKTPSS